MIGTDCLCNAAPTDCRQVLLAIVWALFPSSLTFHLQNLQRSGLITQRRESRQLIYSADFTVMHGLVGYLTENCCGNSGAECSPGCAPALPAKAAKRADKVA